MRVSRVTGRVSVCAATRICVFLGGDSFRINRPLPASVPLGGRAGEADVEPLAQLAVHVLHLVLQPWTGATQTRHEGIIEHYVAYVELRVI